MSIPDPDRPALKGAWPIICHLICLLQARTGAFAADGTTAPLWPLLRLTRVAESLVRRWLVLRACVEGDWPTVPVPRNRQIFSIVIPEKAPAFVRDLAQSRTISKVGLATSPRFLLLEPQPKMRASDYSLEPFEARRGAGSGTGSGEGSSARVRALNPEHLRRRCLALSRVMEAPEHHVRRMARWLARANAIRRETGFGVLHPFRVGWPPGVSRQQKRRDPERQDMLSWLDHLAREAVLRCASP